MTKRIRHCRLPAALLLVMAGTACAAGRRGISDEVLSKAGVKRNAWTHIVAAPAPPRHGKERPPQPACLWLPNDVEKIRGLFYPGTVLIDKKLATDREVRAALAKESMGVLRWPYSSRLILGGGKYLEGALKLLAKASGHPEVEFAPFFTAGHSAAGLFCRNVAYWKPERTIGVVMIKSGNFHHGIEDVHRSLRGVPLLHIVGENEEYGPEGGDLIGGLRSRYATANAQGKRINQTQWVMTRMQMLERRRKHKDNVWTLILDRGGGHTGFGKDMKDLFIKYLHSCAKARIPDEPPDGRSVVRCKPLKAEDGWLYDADIKTPEHAPAPYAKYEGNRNLAFWAPDRDMTKAIWDQHQQGWSHRDPTEGQDEDTRFRPPPLLRDLVDLPDPEAWTWKGGTGTWSLGTKDWRANGKLVPWHGARQAVFAGKGGTVKLEGNMLCSGFKLGPGYTLDLGKNAMKTRWDTELDDGATIRMLVDYGQPDPEQPDSPKSRVGAGNGRIIFQGNVKLGGRVVVEMTGQPVPGRTITLVTFGGLVEGAFNEVIVPKGMQWTDKLWRGRGFGVLIPKPPKPLSEKQKAKLAKEKKENEFKKVFGVDDGGEPPEDLPDDGGLGLDMDL